MKAYYFKIIYVIFLIWKLLIISIDITNFVICNIKVCHISCNITEHFENAFVSRICVTIKQFDPISMDFVIKVHLLSMLCHVTLFVTNTIFQAASHVSFSSFGSNFRVIASFSKPQANLSRNTSSWNFPSLHNSERRSTDEIKSDKDLQEVDYGGKIDKFLPFYTFLKNTFSVTVSTFLKEHSEIKFTDKKVGHLTFCLGLVCNNFFNLETTVITFSVFCIENHQEKKMGHLLLYQDN